MKETAIVVLDHSHWDDWKKHWKEESGKRSNKGSRIEWPLFYVVATGPEVATGPRLDIGLQDDVFSTDGAQGLVPTAEIDWLIDSVIAKFELITHRESCDSVCGSLVDVAALEAKGRTTDDATFVGWGFGQTGNMLSALHALARSSGQPVTEQEPPIHESKVKRLSASQWLDLYTYLQTGAGLKAAVACDLMGKLLDTRFDTNRRLPDAAVREASALFTAAFMRPIPRPTVVLVHGETGTGKAIVARRLHEKISPRGSKYIPLNCSSLGQLADVELFGALAGAYTSRETTTPGALLSARDGTVFLDEFGTLSLRAQEKLLLFLQSGEIRPMGWTEEPLLVRPLVVAATNEHLTDSIVDGKFRRDLYYRFQGRELFLPPLRNTKQTNLRYLVDYFLQSEKLDAQSVGKEAVQKLLDHDYPGNVRELQSAVIRAAGRARARLSTQIGEPDIVFEDSTLPRQDAVLVVIATEEGVLLNWNSYWRQYFFPGRRVETETSRQCLEREMKDKFGLERDDYTFEPMFADDSNLRLIRYSKRQKKLKHFHFDVFRVALGMEVQSKLKGLVERAGRKYRWIGGAGDGRDEGQFVRDSILNPDLLKDTCATSPVSTLGSAAAGDTPSGGG